MYLTCILHHTLSVEFTCRLDMTNMVRAEAGVDIKVLGPQELPACALSNDRVLQYVFCIFANLSAHI